MCQEWMNRRYVFYDVVALELVVFVMNRLGLLYIGGNGIFDSWRGSCNDSLKMIWHRHSAACEHGWLTHHQWVFRVARFSFYILLFHLRSNFHTTPTGSFICASSRNNTWISHYFDMMCNFVFPVVLCPHFCLPPHVVWFSLKSVIILDMSIYSNRILLLLTHPPRVYPVVTRLSTQNTHKTRKKDRENRSNIQLS